MDHIWTDTDKWFFKINPALKFTGIASLFIVYLFVQNLNTMIWATLIFTVIYLCVGGFSARFSFWFILFTFIVSFFSASAIIFFSEGNQVLFRWGLVSISVESLTKGILLGLRSFTFSMIGLIFASTTEPVRFFYSLMQQLRMPVRYAYGCLAAFRMLPMMGEEFIHIRQAMKVRGMTNQKGVRAVYERMKRYALTMLVQSIRRAQRTAVAMEAKRFSLKGKRTFYYEIGWSRYDVIFAIILVVAVGSGFFFSQWLPLTPYTDVMEGY
jgi:energy-coupling factor transport system permease protein